MIHVGKMERGTSCQQRPSGRCQAWRRFVLPDGDSQTGQYVYLKFADKILRFTLKWV